MADIELEPTEKGTRDFIDRIYKSLTPPDISEHLRDLSLIVAERAKRTMERVASDLREDGVSEFAIQGELISMAYAAGILKG